MPRPRRALDSLTSVQAQVARMAVALSKLQVEIARLIRLHERAQPRIPGQPPRTLREARDAAEHQLILELGQECGWSRTRMARTLKLDRKSLYRRMQKYGLAAMHGVPSGPPPRRAVKSTRKSKTSGRQDSRPGPGTATGDDARKARGAR